MAVSRYHIRHQGPVLRSLAQTGWRAMSRQVALPGPVVCPGPQIAAAVPARPAALVDDLVRWSGGDAKAWAGALPPYMFPQWGFPALAQSIREIPYPLARVLNQGCRLEQAGPLDANAPLYLEASLAEVDDNGERARLRQHLITRAGDGVMTADVHAYVPLQRSKKGTSRAPAIVPIGAREILRRRLKTGAGLDFALLTGDFNPVHWLAPYARMAGFRNTILHGFGTMAIATEAVISRCWSGDVRRFGGIEVRFTRPLTLPAQIGVFVVPSADDSDRISVYVGAAEGGGAAMVGTIWPKLKGADHE